MHTYPSSPDAAPAHLFSELIKALHDESEALIANDGARLAAANGRKQHLLRLLAPQASALRAMRQASAPSATNHLPSGFTPTSLKSSASGTPVQLLQLVSPCAAPAEGCGTGRQFVLLFPEHSRK